MSFTENTKRLPAFVACALAALLYAAPAGAADFNSSTADYSLLNGNTSHMFSDFGGSGVDVTVSSNGNIFWDQATNFTISGFSALAVGDKDLNGTETLTFAFSAPVLISSLSIGEMVPDTHSFLANDEVAISVTDSTSAAHSFDLISKETSPGSAVFTADWNGTGDVTERPHTGQAQELTVSEATNGIFGAIPGITSLTVQAASGDFSFLGLSFAQVGPPPGGGDALPEPSTLLLTGLMTLGIGGVAWRRKRAQRAA